MKRWDVWLSGGRNRGPPHHQEGGADGLLMSVKKSDRASQGSMLKTRKLSMDYEEESKCVKARAGDAVLWRKIWMNCTVWQKEAFR